MGWRRYTAIVASAGLLGACGSDPQVLAPAVDASFEDASAPTPDGTASPPDASDADASDVDASTPRDAGTDARSDAGDDGSSGDADASAAWDGAPVALAVGQNEPSGIVVDAKFVYWANQGQSGEIVQCPIAGGCHLVPSPLAAGASYPDSIAVDETNVYYTSNVGGLVEAAPLVFGTGYTLTYSVFPRAIAIDATDVYWTNAQTGALMKCAKTGCSGSPTTLADGTQAAVDGIVVDARNVYWSTLLAIMSVPKSGGKATMLAKSPGTQAAKIAVDDTFVYWTDDVAPSGTVLKVPIDGSADATVLADGQDHPHGIAVDAHSVYWTTNVTGGAVQKVPLAGGVPVSIASNQDHPYGIAVDNANVYWTNQSGGTVMMAAK